MKTETIADAAQLAHTAGTARRERPRRRWLPAHGLAPYAFVVPFLLLFAAFFVAPLVYAFYQSLFVEKRSGLGLGPPTTLFAGLENYSKALHDPNFWDGFGRVLLFGVVQIPVQMLVALVLALLMDSAIIRLRPFFRLAAFVPYAIPGAIAVIMWSFFYSPTSSPIVQLLGDVNLPAPNFLGPGTVLWSIANIATWEFAGFNMIILFSALQGLPQEIYESGRLDGLSEIGIALRLKLPLIQPTLVFGLLFSIIGTLQLFNEPLILSSISNGITSNYTPNIYTYKVAVIDGNLNYGGALAVILGLVVLVFSFAFLRFTRRVWGV